MGRDTNADWPSGLDLAGAASGAGRGAGTPIPDELRARIEAHFGADLSALRVHPNSAVAQARRDPGARAFTSGQDIFFRPGAYNPHTAEGQRLLAHEVSHVVQQGAAMTLPEPPATPPGVPVPYPNFGTSRR